jgi:hypothetical protein
MIDVEAAPGLPALVAELRDVLLRLMSLDGPEGEAGMAEVRRWAHLIGGADGDLVACGGWATAYLGGTMLSSTGLLILRASPVVALSEGQVRELRARMDADPDLAVGEVECWLAAEPVALRWLDAAGIRIEHVAPLIVAAIRRS